MGPGRNRFNPLKLIDGRTGQPIKDEQVGLENYAGYRDISVPQMNLVSRNSTSVEML